MATIKGEGGAFELDQIATPSAAGASKNKVYVKSDGNLYVIDSSSNEVMLGKMTNWTTFNSSEFSFTNFGTTTSFTAKAKRYGDTLRVRVQLTTGTVATGPYFTLANFTIATASMPAGKTIVGTWYQSVGTDAYGSGGRFGPLFVDTSNSRVYATVNASSGDLNTNSSVFSNTNKLDFEFEVPVTNYA